MEKTGALSDSDLRMKSEMIRVSWILEESRCLPVLERSEETESIHLSGLNYFSSIILKEDMIKQNKNRRQNQIKAHLLVCTFITTQHSVPDGSDEMKKLRKEVETLKK